MIKYLILLCIASGIATVADAQNLKRARFTDELLIKPTLPVENIERIAIKLYYPEETVNKDTIRKYIDNMKLLRKGFGDLDEKSMYAYQKLEVVDDNWDLLIEIAYQVQPLGEKEFKIWNTETTLGMPIQRHLYRVSQDLPIVVRLSDKDGQVLDMWEENDPLSIAYGDRTVATQVDSASQSVIRWNPMIFESKAALDNAFAQNGPNHVMRQAVMTRLGGMFNELYRRLYYRTLKNEMFLTTASSRKHDYTDLDRAREEALQAIKSANYNSLYNSIASWEEALEQADIMSKDARINWKLSTNLHANLAIAYMYQQNWNKAWDHALAFEYLLENERPDPNSNTVVYSSNIPTEEKMLPTLFHLLSEHTLMQKGEETPKPEDKVNPLEITREIGKRGKNKKLDLFVLAQRYPAFLKEIEENTSWIPQKRESSYVAKYETASPNFEENPYYRQVVGLGTNVQYVTFNLLDNGGDMNQPFPRQITELTFLDQINAVGFGFTLLPDEISKLKELKRFYLQRNSLTSLPEAIGDLKALKVLNLANNQLTTLPESIRNLTNLKTLNLKNNPVSAEELKKIKSWLPKKCKIKT